MGIIESLAKAYSDYEHGQALPNFYGLRDYYALLKGLSLSKLTPQNLQMVLARNFGETENSARLFEKYFGGFLKTFNNHNQWSYKPIPVVQLIESNLDDPNTRHLMAIGKNESIISLLTDQLKRRNLDPVVIIGSQFPDDREDYNYNVLSRIMVSHYDN